MGACTSAARHHQKQQLHKRITSTDSIVLDRKQLSPSASTTFANQELQYPHFVQLSSSTERSIFHQTDTNSLIQFYSSNTNNNNSNTISWMSSNSHVPPRIPVPKTRLPVHQAQSSSTVSMRPKIITTSFNTNNQTDFTRPMSTTNRTPTSQPRFGFIPRPTAPGLQQAQTSSLAARSRSISPASTASANSSSSSTRASQRLNKTQTKPKPASNRSVAPSSATNASKPKISHNTDSSKAKPTAASRLHSNTPLRASTTSGPPVPPATTKKTDVNAIRDRYKTQTRMNFFTRHNSTTNSLKSPSPESLVIKEEKNEQSIDNQNDDLKTEASSLRDDSAYTSISSPSNHPPSAHHSQGNRHQQRTASMLSSSSALSDVLNQNTILDDDNCSLKSDDLLCDYDDTLTLDSVSKNDRTDSCSSNSLSTEANKKPTMITPVTTTKPNIPPFQPVSKEQRAATVAKCSTPDKTNGSLRESLDELSRLSNRMDNINDGEHNRKLLSRSVSLKPPPTSLPPLGDAEQITMDIESYRQVMKDVMVVKTVLHQLDRLLKHSDDANMTDSMIGSFHDSMIGSRHHSSSGVDNHLRNSIDENSSYDDLLKEIIILRKEKEQDKQTIKLLQEQMYKYSSQTNG